MRPAEITTVIEQEFSSTLAGYHTPVMLWGPPGVGKSQIVAQVAEKHDAAIVDIRLSQMEPSDLRGIPFKNGDKVEWAVPAMLPVFYLPARFIIIGMTIVFGLGLVAGLLPAIQAMRLQIARALRRHV